MAEATKRTPVSTLKAPALRQGFLTEDQVLECIDSALGAEVQVELMDDAYTLVRELGLEVFESEEEARRRVRRSRGRRGRTRRGQGGPEPGGALRRPGAHVPARDGSGAAARPRGRGAHRQAHRGGRGEDPRHDVPAALGGARAAADGREAARRTRRSSRTWSRSTSAAGARTSPARRSAGSAIQAVGRILRRHAEFLKYEQHDSTRRLPDKKRASTSRRCSRRRGSGWPRRSASSAQPEADRADQRASSSARRCGLDDAEAELKQLDERLHQVRREHRGAARRRRAQREARAAGRGQGDGARARRSAAQGARRCARSRSCARSATAGASCAGSRARRACRPRRCALLISRDPPRRGGARAGEEGDDRGERASRDLDRQALHEPRARVPRPDPGGQQRA